MVDQESRDLFKEDWNQFKLAISRFFEEIRGYCETDRRGMRLNLGVILAVAIAISLLATSHNAQKLTWPEWRDFWLSVIFLASFSAIFSFGLGFSKSNIWYLLLVLALSFGIAILLDFLIIGDYSKAALFFTINGLFLGALGYLFGNMLYSEIYSSVDNKPINGYPVVAIAGLTSIVLFSLVFAVPLVFSSIFGHTIDPLLSLFLFITSLFVVGTVLVSIIDRIESIKIHQQNADSAGQISNLDKDEKTDDDNLRTICDRLSVILSNRRSATLGLAGRRGIGKTYFLQHLLSRSDSPTLFHDDFYISEFSPSKHRLRALNLFIRLPTNFEEMSFLSSLFEQLALRVDAALAKIIPPVKPYRVMRELQVKAIHQRMLHRLYFVLFFVMVLLPISVIIFTLPKAFPEAALSSNLFQSRNDFVITDTSKIDSAFSLRRMKSTSNVDSLNTGINFTDNILYQSYLDSLEKQTRLLRDSLHHIEKHWKVLLNPSKSNFLQSPNWYESGNRSSLRKEIDYNAIMDSLLKFTPDRYQTLLDSLDKKFREGQKRLNLIAAQAQHHEQLASKLLEYERPLSRAFSSRRIPLNILWMIFFTIGLLPFIMWIVGREAISSLDDPIYQKYIAHEITLYRRTQEVLERLRFHHTFGEERSLSLGWAGKLGLSFGLNKSKNLIREQVPYTVLSLIEEYRNYIREVCYYLNKASENDLIKEKGEVKIYIAIDELDKVLDSECLHQMLKSIKAIFDIDNVYYLISISEDALDTYRMRSIETKNEVDSSFTHIVVVQPMAAKASIEFFHKRGVPPIFIAPLVVYGAGVPRDMLRFADLAYYHIISYLCDDDRREWLYRNNLYLDFHNLVLENSQNFFRNKTQNSEVVILLREQWDSYADCVRYFFAEDQQAITNLIKQQPGLSAIWKQRLLDLILLDKLTTESLTEENLKNLSEIDLKEFIESNRGTADENRKLFFKLHTLISGYFIKNHLHRKLLKYEPQWLKNARDDFKTNDLPPKVIEWLEHQRAVAYEISNHPLGASEWSKESSTVSPISLRQCSPTS